MYAQSGSVHAREPTVALLTAVFIAAFCIVVAWYFLQHSREIIRSVNANVFVFYITCSNVCLASGKMPEEAKEVQMSGQQQVPQARSKQGAESKDGNQSQSV